MRTWTSRPIRAPTVSGPKDQFNLSWSLHEGRWTLLAIVYPDARGSALLIVESPALAVPPEAVKVTLEPAGHGSEPTGPAVIQWERE